MQLEIVTPDKKVFQGEVSEASFPGASGAFQVLNNHAPIVLHWPKEQFLSPLQRVNNPWLWMEELWR